MTDAEMGATAFGCLSGAEDAVHLIPHDGAWGVRSDSSQEPEMVFPTRADAVSAAKEVARTAGLALLYHAPSGRVVHREDFAS